MQIKELESELHKLNIKDNKIGKIVCSEPTFNDFIAICPNILYEKECIIWKIGNCILEICIADIVYDLCYGEVLVENFLDSLMRKVINLENFT